MQNEKWVDIEGFDGLYMVSNFGRVLSSPKHQNGYKSIIRKQNIDNRGYLRVCVGKGGVKSTFKVHRLVAKYFLGNPCDLNEVNHKDGVKTNNAYDNLEWCTRGQNMVHAYANGLCKPKNGVNNINSKIGEEVVNGIYKSSKQPKFIADEFSVKICTVYDIRNKRTWAHLTNNLD